jgi:hypothetical protein
MELAILESKQKDSNTDFKYRAPLELLLKKYSQSIEQSLLFLETSL